MLLCCNSFPSGMALSVRIDDTKFAIDEGADEVDMVISESAFLSGEHQKVYDNISILKKHVEISI